MTSLGSMDAVRGVREARLRDLERRVPAAALVEHRRAAFEQFVTRGFPTTRDEAWRHTDVAPIARATYGLAPEVALPTARDVDAVALARVAGPRLVFVNGRYAAGLSNVTTLQTGVVVESLQVGLAGAHASQLLAHLLETNSTPSSVFRTLNAALFEDGAYVRIAPRTVVDATLQLIFLNVPAPGNDAAFEVHPRIVIVAESGSQTRLATTWSGAGASFTNAVTTLVVEDSAIVSHFEVQRQSKQAQHMAWLRATLGRDARFASHVLALGAGLSRNEVEVAFGAPGGDCLLNGLYAGDGSQHTDMQTFVDHAQPHCTSNQLYKGVLAGEARGVFNGRILVRPQAQKTDAHQTNRNLLLSESALVDTKPQLEIHADDVKCTHGATIGRLQEEPLFYLRSRGIGPSEARDILIHAFARQTVADVRPDVDREALEGWIGCRLAAFAGLGGAT